MTRAEPQREGPEPSALRALRETLDRGWGIRLPESFDAQLRMHARRFREGVESLLGLFYIELLEERERRLGAGSQTASTRLAERISLELSDEHELGRILGRVVKRATRETERGRMTPLGVDPQAPATDTRERRLQDFVDGLTPELAAIVLLRIEGRKVAEIALGLHLSPATISRRLQEAKRLWDHFDAR